jgi:FkbM family methyltransferase
MATCVYTCLTGGYERLNEQPVARRSNIPFICLTDDPSLRSDTWQVRQLPMPLRDDPVRSQRILKILPHRHLGDFERSIYIDNSVMLTAAPEKILETYAGDSSFAAPLHSYREYVIDEFAEVSTEGLDDPARVSEQLLHYQASDPDGLLDKPFWTAILLRDHRDARLAEALREWAAHVLRYSRRDQLSLNHVLRRAGVSARAIDIDNYASWFHTWPAILDRRNDVRRFHRFGSAASNGNAVGAREAFATRREEHLTRALARAEGQILEQQNEIRRLRESRSWRMTAPLRVLGNRFRTARQPAPTRTPPSITLPNGRQLFLDRSDQRAGALAQAAGDLNPVTMHIWRLLCAERSWQLIVDVGANYGEMVVGVDLPANAKVIAVEPNPYLLPFLLRTIRESGHPIEILAAAVTDGGDYATITIDREWSGMSSLVAGQAQSADHATEVCTVPATTLERIVGNSAAAASSILIKVDVEGHEAAVLRGIGDLPASVEHFAVLTEILHLGDDDLGWILDRFALELYDRREHRLIAVPAPDVAALRSLLRDDRYYPQDAVLRLK